MTTAPTVANYADINIKLTKDELAFVDDVLRYGEEDYIRRSKMYAEQYRKKADEKKRYHEYFEKKKKMFITMRYKLITALDNNGNDKSTPMTPFFVRDFDDEDIEKKDNDLTKHYIATICGDATSDKSIADAYIKSIVPLMPHIHHKKQREQITTASIARQATTPDVTVLYECAACGKPREYSTKMRRYFSPSFRHPTLRALPEDEPICGSCKGWDYDIYCRERHGRRPLQLNDGRILNPVKEESPTSTISATIATTASMYDDSDKFTQPIF